MKRLYIIKNIITVICLILLVVGLNFMIKGNHIGFILPAISIILIFIMKNNYFKKIEYKNSIVDFIFRIASIITFIYILIIGINIIFIK